MTSHYLFAAEFCNRAAGWEKGIVEKNVQDRRRQMWVEAGTRHWPDLDTLNAWLAMSAAPHGRCRRIPMPPHHRGRRLEDEQPHLMPMPAPFDGYVERPVRVSSTALIQLPAQPLQRAVRTRARGGQPAGVSVRTGRGGRRGRVARHRRSFERDRVHYDWQHYIALVQRKPGALRDGAPFLSHARSAAQAAAGVAAPTHGDRAMAQVLAAVPVHGLEAVLVAVELVLESGAGQRRTRAQRAGAACSIRTARSRRSPRDDLRHPPASDPARYDALRGG
jgi:hypothetical protein